MSRTNEQITQARKARNACARKLRRLGYKFPKKTVRDFDVVAAIHRITGWARPGRGESVGYMQRFASMAEGQPTPSRQHDALHAPEYRPDRWLRAAAERAAKAQHPLIHAVSRIPGAMQEATA
ncbi:hypothetical protein ACOTJL_19535 [Achromobacter xylosoxidans]|uniref:hypothetical protein n=1 Tax=Alcaligenes xylosoxydans xylosoxydans TaxID=85698 RepID=UPI00047D1EA7|nr:hypothetical protein [Achromobacter xylosoxidans]